MSRCYRRVIRIRGEDSPNVRMGTGEVIIPGVLPLADYKKRRATWDPIRQCIGLDAQFWEGSEVLMFPPEWLNRAEKYADDLSKKQRKAVAIGIDPAEGGDLTAMAAVDEHGLLELVSRRTNDTDVIAREALAFMRKHGVDPKMVAFDRGGGGKQHADRLRAQGHQVRTVAFGESVSIEPQRELITFARRFDTTEDKYAYKNRRSEMYGDLRALLDPSNPTRGTPFAIPARYTRLRSELAPIPMTYDAEGRLQLLPKRRSSTNSHLKTLTEVIGHSPDEADALVLAVYAMFHRKVRPWAGVLR